jgi:hypothetical protein
MAQHLARRPVVIPDLSAGCNDVSAQSDLELLALVDCWTISVSRANVQLLKSFRAFNQFPPSGHCFGTEANAGKDTTFAQVARACVQPSTWVVTHD